MKTQTNKPRFHKKAIVDLNTSQMVSIKGGSTTFFVDWVQNQIDEAKEDMSPYI
ncbi:hypothetical protein N7U66_12745 [Lacinutrix neustonica]|uniref:Bacteriocin n=1 Tax=Lacinutrix neustonica TaxID=2980107 RepID=A0A9E8MTB7_9FLAO|nr:hypothetical protein [Lacinutrix neustonica]WAC01043.1 hypothetical protein N7U66_12745 [Lacinutrix neustonica]